jgi:hypothetical protein
MELNEKWDDNLVLNYIEGNTNNAEELSVIWMNFDFYDCNYEVGLSKRDLDSDWLSLSLDGDSKLFNSCEELLENKFAEKVKEQFKRYQDYLIAEEEEWNKPIPPLDTTKYKRIYWKEFFKDEDTDESIEIERSQVVDLDYELEEYEYLKD